MIWNEIEGNLITLAKQGEFDVITHGCNCFKNFGAGLALQIKKYYPLAYEADLNSDPIMGNISICKDYGEVDIVNSYTQLYPGRNKYGKDSNENRYIAISECMRKINQQYKGQHIGLPLIGAGLAGLDWEKVKSLIKAELRDLHTVTIVHFK